MALQLYDVAGRAREKVSSREEDERAMSSGEKSPEQLRRENASFAFANARIRFPLCDR